MVPFIFVLINFVALWFCWSYTKLENKTEKYAGLFFFIVNILLLIFGTSLTIEEYRYSMGLDILQLVISLVMMINGFYWFFSGVEIWNKLNGIAFLSVATGTPIIFTSLTRSVFEVSKLLNLRLALIWITAVFLLKAVITKERITFVKTALNWPLLAFVLVNIVSVILSTNKYIAILGAYDRWEGILTELNYIVFIFYYINFVKDRKTFFWLLGSLLIGATLSAIYGIFQANGIDFMNWSVDPTARVFGCINNPVHYAPYIMMHLPLLIGFIFYFIKKYNFNSLQLKKVSKIKDFFITNRYVLYMYLLLISSFLIYYVSGFLSFGRACWIGASMAISLILYFIYLKESKYVLKDFIFMMAAILLFNAIEVFKVQQAKPILWLPIIALAVFCFLFVLFDKERRKEYLLFLSFVVFGGLMQFLTVSIVRLLINIFLIVILIYKLKDDNEAARKIKSFLLIMMVATMAISARDSLSASVAGNINNLKKTELNVATRATSYAGDFAKGTARTSMWVSGFRMWKDAPLFGQGPGMIKELYPKYRLANYGRLEGGHNFTPDKLHNDYINMLATRGLAGFIVYYLWLLPLAGYFILNKIRKEGMTASNYLLAGLFSGLFVYLGQVIFNFGVVATRVIFYEYFCLALVLVINKPFADEENKNLPQ